MDENKKFQKGDTAVYRIGFKEKRSGATRVCVGFSVADSIMPYLAMVLLMRKYKVLVKFQEQKKLANG
ncbi:MULTISPECIES: hypothetical protein [unclassified Bartonella]|uniref:hypothetical protein n=1 Tax=unclassified Bartonella TaxID=2645622 RepID=UPI0035D0CDCF